MPEAASNPDLVLLPDTDLRLLTFLFALPEQLPVPDASTLTMHLPPGPMLDERWNLDAIIDLGDVRSERPMSIEIPLVSLRFWQPEVIHRFDLGDAGLETVLPRVWPPTDEGSRLTAAPDIPSETPSYRTYIQAVTQGGLAHGEPVAPNVVGACFNRCLRALNEFIDGYAVASGDPVSSVSAPRLGLLAFASSKRLGIPESDVGPIFYLMPWVPRHTSKPMLDPDEWNQVSIAARLGKSGHPFFRAVRLHQLALRTLYDGAYGEAVIFAATAGEILLNSLLRSVLVEAEEVDRARGVFTTHPGLKARARSQYHTRLGGGDRWNPDSPGSPLHTWWQTVQVVRGRFVHAGLQPTPQQAADAVEATEDLERFTHDRVIAHRFTFPATLLLTVPPDELERRGIRSRRFQELIAQTDVEAHLQNLRDVATEPEDLIGGPT